MYLKEVTYKHMRFRSSDTQSDLCPALCDSFTLYATNHENIENRRSHTAGVKDESGEGDRCGREA